MQKKIVACSNDMPLSSLNAQIWSVLLTENVNVVTIVMQMSQNKKLQKAQMISVLWKDSGISLALTAIFILGPFAYNNIFWWIWSNEVSKCLELNGRWPVDSNKLCPTRHTIFELSSKYKVVSYFLWEVYKIMYMVFFSCSSWQLVYIVLQTSLR